MKVVRKEVKEDYLIGWIHLRSNERRIHINLSHIFQWSSFFCFYDSFLPFQMHSLSIITSLILKIIDKCKGNTLTRWDGISLDSPPFMIVKCQRQMACLSGVNFFLSLPPLIKSFSRTIRQFDFLNSIECKYFAKKYYISSNHESFLLSHAKNHLIRLCLLLILISSYRKGGVKWRQVFFSYFEKNGISPILIRMIKLFEVIIPSKSLAPRDNSFMPSSSGL